MTDQIPLFVEDYNEAIRATVQALGGFKRIGAEMKPDLAVEAAGRWLMDCCNPERREKLAPSELAYIRRRARTEGVHILASFEMREAGYADPMPITPEDEAAQLQREFVQASKGMAALFNRMERAGLKVVA
jgi:plasmid stabilization system protein ParE